MNALWTRSALLQCNRGGHGSVRIGLIVCAVHAHIPSSCCSEPDSYGLTWLGTQLKGQGLGYWYHQIMKIGYAINPSACSSPFSLLESELRHLCLPRCMGPLCYVIDIAVICAEALYMFEGMAQGGLGANWGDGHATDASLMSLVRCAPRLIRHLLHYCNLALRHTFGPAFFMPWTSSTAGLLLCHQVTGRAPLQAFSSVIK